MSAYFEALRLVRDVCDVGKRLADGIGVGGGNGLHTQT